MFKYQQDKTDAFTICMRQEEGGDVWYMVDYYPHINQCIWSKDIHKSFFIDTNEEVGDLLNHLAENGRGELFATHHEKIKPVEMEWFVV